MIRFTCVICKLARVTKIYRQKILPLALASGEVICWASDKARREN